MATEHREHTSWEFEKRYLHHAWMHNSEQEVRRRLRKAVQFVDRNHRQLLS